MDWTVYWYMFPTALAVATLASATGIEGATFFSPIFILILKLNPLIAIGTALITEVFGFGSGVYAYMRRKLIDYKLASHLLVATTPLALAGALLASQIAEDVLKLIFGGGLLIIGLIFLRSPDQSTIDKLETAVQADFPPHRAERTLITTTGEEIHYTVCNRAEGITLAGIGGLFMGLIGSGQGEMNGYFLLRRCHVPLKVAIATSAFVVAITALVASITHLVNFVREGGEVLSQVLSLVLYTVPGVIIGGQLGPVVSTRMDTHKMEKLLGSLFVGISVIMIWTAVR